MKIMDMPRGTGKSSILFYLSQEYQCPVVTREATIKLYKDKYPNAIPMTYEEFLRTEPKPKHIYLDEIDVFMQAILPDTKILIGSCSNNNDGIEHFEDFI